MKLPSYREMLAALVAAPSVSSTDPALDQPNRPVIDLLAGWAESVGARVEIEPVDEARGKYNLLATLGEGESGLLLGGHVDTVPCDPDRWHSDPWRLREEGGRYYGLGATDMKGFFPLVLELMARVDAASLRRPLVLLATADEESTMAGARLLDGVRLPASHAVIGEPTDLAPVFMHKGIMMESLRLTGRSGHSSNPALGVNAIEGMHEVIGALLHWREQLAGKWSDERFEVPVPTLNLGVIHGGDNPNRICGECELQFDLRLLPGMDLAELERDLARLAADAVAGTGLKMELQPLFEGVPAHRADPDGELLQALVELSGRPAKSVAFGTEAPFLAGMGLEAVVFGPGSIDQAHQPDEYLEISRTEECRTVLAGVVERFCTRGPEAGRRAGHG
ncbi:MAG: acetylornithine deacetylase [Gammaproteobacteria bacterium]|nr:MAG: acetylornithine deacetylase [Gammaproteobacteria bacterium]